MTAQQKRIRSPRWLWFTIIALCCAVVLDLLVFFTFPLRFLYPATYDDRAESMQAAAILFNDFNSDFTGINNETRRRVNHGLSLLNNKKVEQLIVVGGNREASKRKGSQLMADYLMKQGVPAEKILIESSSKDSVSNLEQLGMILAERNIDTLGLISSPYHLLRLQTITVPFRAEIKHYSYNPADCAPPLTRSEVWFSAHYNVVAYFAQVLLPETLYRKIVMWIRENTEW